MSRTKPDYPLCAKHGIYVEPNGYVSWPVWKAWKAMPENAALIDGLPAGATVCTVCEWGIPACDVEQWLAMARGKKPHPLSWD
jgi:hypothetical protein